MDYLYIFFGYAAHLYVYVEILIVHIILKDHLLVKVK